MKNPNKGHTIIELIMVIVIVGILAAASSLYVKQTIDLWRFMNFRSEVVSQGRMSLQRIAREIRQVKDKSSIYTATANEFNFQNTAGHTIDYHLTGNQLMRTDNGIDNILAAGITSLVFVYYDSAGNTTATLSSIYWIKVTITINSGTQTKTLTISVRPRNLN